MTTPTPRTDAYLEVNAIDEVDSDGIYCLVKFARQLERELSDQKQRLAEEVKLRPLWAQGYSRDSIAAQLLAVKVDELKAALKIMQERAEIAETALDSAYKALDEMARAR